jgi:GT2 family glycosyltransferase
MNGIADHVLRGFPLSRPPLDDALVYVRERSAVTAACLMMKRTDYEHVGGFDEHFGTHLQDVDLCMKLRMLGRRNLVDPGAVLIHHESVTRSYEPDVGDDTLLVQRWREQIIASDPFFHPSYDRNCLNLALQHVRLSDQ